YPSCESAAEARAALEHTLTREHIEGELAYVGPRSGFKRPYGVGWLVTLALELHEWNEPEALRWAEVLSPLTDLAAERLATYFEKLTHPVRSGEHSQTAFALGLAIDWARGVGALDHAARYEKE